MNRRQFLQCTTSAAVASLAGVPAVRAASTAAAAAAAEGFKLNYIMGSAMYGNLSLETILQETPKTGAKHLDVWPKKHGTQREEMDEIGHDKVMALLEKYDVKLECITRYDRGPFKLQDEFPIAKKFGAKLIVTGAAGPKGLQGEELKKAVKDFVEQMKPHAAAAAEHDIKILIENHSNSLIFEPDSLRWFAEYSQGQPLDIIFAPYHLPQDPELIAGLIRELGNRIRLLCAWQYGKGCMKPMPKEEELEQMPGRGPLDFKPLLKAMKDVNYDGWTQIFMHPTPRGIPILPTAEETTAEINRSRIYLDGLVASL